MSTSYYDPTEEEDGEELSGKDRANKDLLYLNHRIRATENNLRIARGRRIRGHVFFALGPALALVLYILWHIPAFESWYAEFALPSLLLALFSISATVILKLNPGGPKIKDENGKTEKRRQGRLLRFALREGEDSIELGLSRLRDRRKLLLSKAGFDQLVRRLSYREDAYEEIDRLRSESNKYRRVNNTLQGVLIIGSLTSTGAAGVAATIPQVRWIILGLTLLVGVASGFLGYFKYKERSFYLQQTADSIEEEWEAFEVGVGRYKYIKSERDRLAEFSDQVHRLKSEQKKRQQNLEQPPEMRQGGDV